METHRKSSYRLSTCGDWLAHDITERFHQSRSTLSQTTRYRARWRWSRKRTAPRPKFRDFDYGLRDQGRDFLGCTEWQSQALLLQGYDSWRGYVHQVFWFAWRGFAYGSKRSCSLHASYVSKLTVFSLDFVLMNAEPSSILKPQQMRQEDSPSKSGVWSFMNRLLAQLNT